MTSKKDRDDLENVIKAIEAEEDTEEDKDE